jgi:hypothetical protein
MTRAGSAAVADGFTCELMRRLPLARAVMEAFNHAFDPLLLERIYEANRGRCYSDVLQFSDLVDLTRDALLEHQGSGHRMYQQLKRTDSAPAHQSSFYRKLGNMPQAVSRALLCSCTLRLGELIVPRADLLPGCFDGLEVMALDGKKLKNAAKRLKPTRGFSGSLLAAKALVAMSVNSGLAVAMSDSLDGEANEVPLVKDLLPQVYQAVGDKPLLFVCDRQMGDYRTPRLMLGRPGDHFLLRIRSGLAFTPDPAEVTRLSSDEHGRVVVDEVGTFGTGTNALRVRRVTLRRQDASGRDDDVVLITDLLDRRKFPAQDLLKLYRRRWGIERMFQEVTETFSLEHLIGCEPRGALFQFSLCLLMYNLVRVVKAYVAADGRVDVDGVSTSNLFYDVKRELQAASYLAPGALAALAGRPPREPEAMRRRLAQLLEGTWDPVAYTKAADKKPRPPRPEPKRIHGGHTSVLRLLEGRVKLKASKK